MHGTWFAPAMGKTATPLGLDGEGTPSFNDVGVTLTGRLQSKNAASVFGCLGFIIGFALVVVIGVALKLEGGRWGLVAILGAPAGVWLGRKLFPAKEVTLQVPWAELKKLRVDSGELDKPVLAFVVSRGFFSGQPKGAVYFLPRDATPDVALAQLQPFAERAVK